MELKLLICLVILKCCGDSGIMADRLRQMRHSSNSNTTTDRLTPLEEEMDSLNELMRTIDYQWTALDVALMSSRVGLIHNIVTEAPHCCPVPKYKTIIKELVNFFLELPEGNHTILCPQDWDTNWVDKKCTEISLAWKNITQYMNPDLLNEFAKGSCTFQKTTGNPFENVGGFSLEITDNSRTNAQALSDAYDQPSDDGNEAVDESAAEGKSGPVEFMNQDDYMEVYRVENYDQDETKVENSKDEEQVDSATEAQIFVDEYNWEPMSDTSNGEESNSEKVDTESNSFPKSGPVMLLNDNDLALAVQTDSQPENLSSAQTEYVPNIQYDIQPEYISNTQFHNETGYIPNIKSGVQNLPNEQFDEKTESRHEARTSEEVNDYITPIKSESEVDPESNNPIQTEEIEFGKRSNVISPLNSVIEHSIVTTPNNNLTENNYTTINVVNDSTNVEQNFPNHESIDEVNHSQNQSLSQSHRNRSHRPRKNKRPKSLKPLKKMHDGEIQKGQQTPVSDVALLQKYSFRDCSDISKLFPNENSGTYTIIGGKLSGNSTEVYCDFENSDEPWTVIQRRDDKHAFIKFNRDWETYKRGFGNPATAFWIGLDSLHALTSATNYRLRIEMEDYDNVTRTANYEFFDVGSPSEKFTLTVDKYSGDAGDSLSPHSGAAFSTPDNDNDFSEGNCALEYTSGWWFHDCLNSNLNGIHSSHPEERNINGLIWESFRGLEYSLKRTEMKILAHDIQDPTNSPYPE